MNTRAQARWWVRGAPRAQHREPGRAPARTSTTTQGATAKQRAARARFPAWPSRCTPQLLQALRLTFLVALAGTAAAQDPPTEFVTQVLEPTGGKIQRPKEWFYAEQHSPSVYRWFISREDPRGNKPYVTGVSIQAFAGVKEGTGKSAQQFMLDFLAARSREASRVVRTCAPHDEGLFVRQCLETEEGPYHILYSAFWGANGMDMSVLSTAGTTKELWDSYAATFNKMSAFELIDMARFPAPH